MKLKVVSLLIFVILIVVLINPVLFAQEKVEIDFWYALSGHIREVTLDMVEDFNTSQNDIQVNPVHRGSYAEALTAAIAAYRTGNAPHVVQVYEVGTQTLLDSKAIVPVYQLFEDNNIIVDWNDFLGPLKAYYSVDDNLSSLPFNSSTPFLFYNKDAFREAGLDPNKPPRTFEEMEEYGEKLVESGVVENAITFGWPSWTMIENMFAWHGEAITNNSNGYDGHATELYINNDFGITLFNKYKELQDKNILAYEGREGTPNPSFLTGKTAMIITSTAYLGGFKETADFEIGSGFLPRFEDKLQGNSLIGGATLWVFDGHEKEEYKAVAEFLSYVASVDQQVDWHKSTGYLPVTISAVNKLESQGWFNENPNHATAFNQLQVETHNGKNVGLRLGDFTSIREILLAEIENIFAGNKSVEKALNDAVAKSNARLERYVRVNK
ncbi:MAG: extracellular solute-binding protein [Bacillota bacterium]